PAPAPQTYQQPYQQPQAQAPSYQVPQAQTPLQPGPEEPEPAVVMAEPKMYEPTPSDSMLPWNDHDPWGGAFKLAFTTSTNQFVNGPVKGAGGEFGLRLGSDFIAISG